MRMYIIICFSLLLWSCRKPYEASVNEEVGTVLVVEGGLAVGDSADNKILLSRLQPLQDTVIGRPEQGAQVAIISNTGRIWNIPEVLPGEYRSLDNIPLNNEHKLRVITRSGKRYETPFLKTVRTPEIDSVTYREGQDVELFVHTHDPADNTKYYRWDYTETWEYRSWYDSGLIFQGDSVALRPPGDQVYSCWRNAQSEKIIIANTLALSENRISFQPLTTLVRPEERLSVRYSILVRQYGLTKEAFEFWNILRRNTELTGSLFDPQPSQLPGNIVCLDDPSERVIGFISAGEQVSKRIFVRSADLNSSWPKEDERLNCVERTGLTKDMELVLKQDTSLGPAYFITPDGLAIADKRCVDCRRKGGTNIKPSFW